MKKLFLFFICLLVGGCGGNGQDNILQLPKLVASNASARQLFVVDSQHNNLSVIDLTTNSLVDGKPLIDQDSAIRLPTLPQDLAVADLGGGVSRLFIIGTGDAVRNRIVVLDYDTKSGFRTASFSPMIVGQDNAADQGDVLGGLVIDQTSKTLYVSNSTDSIVRAYDATSGSEKLATPIVVAQAPLKMSFDSVSGYLFVSSAASQSVSIINTANLTQTAGLLDVGFGTTDVAVSTNAQGSALFAVSHTVNQVAVFKLNLQNPSQSVLIGSPIQSPAPTAALASTDLISGVVEQVASVVLSSGEIAAAITESTGDLGYIQVSADLTTITTGRVAVINGQSAYGLQIDQTPQGAVNAYFAAPGGSTVSFVDLTGHVYSGQFF